MKEIPIADSNGLVIAHAMVDDEDFPVLARMPWWLTGGCHRDRARRLYVSACRRRKAGAA